MDKEGLRVQGYEEAKRLESLEARKGRIGKTLHGTRCRKKKMRNRFQSSLT
jgi:hypothetical protein